MLTFLHHNHQRHLMFGLKKEALTLNPNPFLQFQKWFEGLRCTHWAPSVFRNTLKSQWLLEVVLQRRKLLILKVTQKLYKNE